MIKTWTHNGHIENVEVIRESKKQGYTIVKCLEHPCIGHLAEVPNNELTLTPITAE